MDLVVLTAALSSLNAGLYSTGRILHSMSMAGFAPEFAGRMNSAGVPYGGIALTALIAPLGVGLNAVVPEEAFEIVLDVACLGILSSLATIAAEVITSQSRALPTTERARRRADSDPGVKELPFGNADGAGRCDSASRATAPGHRTAGLSALSDRSG